MINNDELLFVVDEYDNPQKPMPRHIVKKNGSWFRAVHVWIVNGENKILCQKRSSFKDQGPGLWEPAVAGHISPSDNYFTGAVREVREETGLLIKTNDLRLVKIYRDDKFFEYRGVFTCRINATLDSIKQEKEEVDDVKLLKLSTLKKYLLHGNSEDWIRHTYQKEMFSILN